MLDETLDLLIDEVAKLVPDVVLGAIFLVTGLLTAMLGVATLLGVATVGWSPRFVGGTDRRRRTPRGRRGRLVVSMTLRIR
ncbi:hypothetical protein PM022_08560 [Halorubrum ezzemoulense]|uniref:hypothetical protein n=1 Tax=Halorubrum ezzemoulense TaxID=337243 RepID=UPI00233120BE|nr:hypothetical protein [Halorubrum ezzemoulense]MDB2274596.1 hypothetical protein [Halorubrum ezzemoulense]